ncbi:hypothetical protein BDZ91DRAFT_747036 [Kalaharituber pfeilii]|nr:hypothetical protein BDZ91DRAFT_747036 [Kalaharituber pfeilii]
MHLQFNFASLLLLLIVSFLKHAQALALPLKINLGIIGVELGLNCAQQDILICPINGKICPPGEDKGKPAVVTTCAKDKDELCSLSVFNDILQRPGWCKKCSGSVDCPSPPPKEDPPPPPKEDPPPPPKEDPPPPPKEDPPPPPKEDPPPPPEEGSCTPAGGKCTEQTAWKCCSHMCVKEADEDDPYCFDPTQDLLD